MHRSRFEPMFWELPSHYLSTHKPGRPGCIISMQKGVKAKSTGKRLVRKRSFPLYIFPSPGFKYLFQGYCKGTHNIIFSEPGQMSKGLMS